jgi:hypothetical protein
MTDQQVLDFVDRSTPSNGDPAGYIAREMHLTEAATSDDIQNYKRQYIDTAPDILQNWINFISASAPPAPPLPPLVAPPPAPEPVAVPQAPQAQMPAPPVPAPMPAPQKPQRQAIIPRIEHALKSLVHKKRSAQPHEVARASMPQLVPQAPAGYTLVQANWTPDVRNMHSVDTRLLPGQFVVDNAHLEQLRQAPEMVFPQGANPFPGGTIYGNQVSFLPVTSDPARINAFIQQQPLGLQNGMYNPQFVQQTVSKARRHRIYAPKAQHIEHVEPPEHHSRDVHPAATASRLNTRRERALKHNEAVRNGARTVHEIAELSRREY